MLNALGRVLLISIWKFESHIDNYLIKHTYGKPEYMPGYLRLGARQTLNLIKRFDDGAREHLLATMADKNDQKEQTFEWLSQLLSTSVNMMTATISVSPASEKHENIKYWFTSCKFLNYNLKMTI